MPLLIALVLIGHAVMHVGAVSCGFLFESAPPSVVTGVGIGLDAMRTIAIFLTLIAVAGYLLAALAGAGIVVPKRWWRSLVVIASVASTALLVGLFSPPAVPGLAIDAALLWAVLVRSWRPTPLGAVGRGADRATNQEPRITTCGER